MTRLALTALLVRDYDEAIDWYTRVLGFRLVSDRDMGGGKRWVEIAADGGGALLLARARKPEELAAVGNQFGGRVGLFLHVDDFEGAQARLSKAGATFEEAPRREAYGIVAVFRDLYGNRWDLIEPLPYSLLTSSDS
jgi:catechol 2,3-dioxygenase-like lactoylglutathione lyase family enzyme